jgi:indolepyruvate ferredoxin oxidoreductase beta subunit
MHLKGLVIRKMNNLNIMIVGVGGQGSLLASRMIGTAALKSSYDVKVSEVHGMSQRGGSVVTYVKLGKSVSSPLIEKGEGDIIISFEILEALRWTDYLKEDGKIIVNNQAINPMPVIIGREKYPSNILENLDSFCNNVICIKALEIAKELGNTKVVNIILIGILAKISSIKKDIWLETLKDIVPSKFYDINKKAFEIGYEFKF